MSFHHRFHGRGLLRWHVSLTGKAYLRDDGRPSGPDAADGGQKGQRAELKRVATSEDTMLSPAYAALVAACYPGALEHRDSGLGIISYEIEALARTAMILAHVDRCREGRSLSAAFSHGRERPAVSAARVSALFRTQDPEDAARQIRWMLPMTDGFIDPIKLHDGMRNWETRRKDWAAEYHLARLKPVAAQDDVAA